MIRHCYLFLDHKLLYQERSVSWHVVLMNCTIFPAGLFLMSYYCFFPRTCL